VQVSLDLLQVSEVSGIMELKQAYHARIKRLHPDVNQHQDTTDEAAAVNAAYSTLCEVRGQYDSSQAAVLCSQAL
jgi:DnaJ-class molecular chaperone